MAALRGQLYEARLDGCTLGACDKRTKELVLKPWLIVTTSKLMRDSLSRRCNHGCQHLPLIGGSRVAESAFYPKPMCRRIAQVVLTKNSWADIDYYNKHADSFTADSVQATRRSRDMGLLDSKVSDKEKERLDAIVRKVHINLGHPPQERFLKLLRLSGAKAAVMDVAKAFRCPVCEELHRPGPRRPTVLTELPPNGHALESDGFEWKHPKKGSIHKGIVMCDRGS